MKFRGSEIVHLKLFRFSGFVGGVPAGFSRARRPHNNKKAIEVLTVDDINPCITHNKEYRLRV